MKCTFLLQLIIIFSALDLYNPCFSQQIGIFDNHQDIGMNVKPGSATFIPETSQYIISGEGYNIRGDHDEFQFVYKNSKEFLFYMQEQERSCFISFISGQ
jgi:TolB protein